MNNKYAELIDELSDKELLKHLYMTQVILVVLSLVIGYFLFDSWKSFLGLFDWNDPFIWWVGVPAGFLIVCVDAMFMKFLPSSYYDDGGLNEKLFSNRKGWEILFIAAIVATSEEILFRGIIQTHFGLIVSSIIFAVIHYRYLFNWFLFLNIILLSFFIGVIYEWTGNLLVTIMMHFVIDALLGFMIKRKERIREERERNE
ncbi:CPBP family intramembrane metalloprotease [Robertmurraya korlensis]|uniref:CPBP family intramembrane glutamic endopeptidase n=1 Tax=Robertmurraya korlensis TaxID=519977 RepID=UPI002040ED5E|nr:type II CAAX endopeptidase family protein [Robertmurraya korlensis]MCM3599744.1 CPBP family intramembrane metalloprotease [Robertmurraya korlensis]